MCALIHAELRGSGRGSWVQYRHMSAHYGTGRALLWYSTTPTRLLAMWYAALALGVYGDAVMLVTVIYSFVPKSALGGAEGE